MSDDIRFQRVNPAVAYFVGAILGGGVVQSWLTSGNVAVPIAFFVVASVFLLAGEFENYLSN